ncbi:MFS transporter [Paenibacillus abyssi]|uniref:MFS-type transporter YxlH n=1 Tax=Paenibacillus abyssi TaxID=1340531 RepID=A0A917FXK7_9BACL|nr:MFS transporter [Paenibacillus abyssi]GGG11703.1 putative MFS-type transporter YxlH [Paenibacillus abyssi]
MQQKTAILKDQPPIETTVLDHAVFIIVTILYWSALFVYVPILTPYLEFRGLSLQLIGLVLGSYGLTQLIVRFPLGIASDKLHRRKPFIMLGLLTAVISCLFYIIPGSWLWPLTGRILSGVSASTWVAFTVLYASYFSASSATRAMGTISFMTVSGQLIGMTLSGWLAEAFSWNAAFLAGICIGLTGLALTFLIKEPSEGIQRTPMSLSALVEVVRSPILIRVSILSIFAHSILFITMFGFTPLQATSLGASKLELSYVVIAFMIPHALTSLFSGKWFAPRLGEWRLARIGFLLGGIFTASIAFSPTLGWLMLTQALNGFALGLIFPLLLGMAIKDFEPSKRATAMGFYQAIYSVGMFMGPFLAGWLNEVWGLQSGFYYGASVAFAAVLLITLWKKPQESVLGNS